MKIFRHKKRGLLWVRTICQEKFHKIIGSVLLTAINLGPRLYLKKPAGRRQSYVSFPSLPPSSTPLGAALSLGEIVGIEMVLDFYHNHWREVGT